MKTMVVALALLCCATASAEEESCKDERDRYHRAVEAFENAEFALDSCDESSLAPVVPGQLQP